MKKITIVTALFLASCVTINIYFPAAAAEKAADKIIQEIQQSDSVEPQSQLQPIQQTVYLWIDTTLNFLIPAAQAADADLAIDSAEIRRLRTQMRNNFSSLAPFYQQGFVGLKSDGLLTVRDAAGVPLKDRNLVNKLVAAENSARNQLYQAIANANGHPEWFAQIKSTFAERWQSNAQAGWWYQSSNGSWKQK